MCCGNLFVSNICKIRTKKKATKGIVTNMLNRLIIMMDEELLFADVRKYIILRRLMEKFEEDNRNNFIYLYKICDILVNANITVK